MFFITCLKDENFRVTFRGENKQGLENKMELFKIQAKTDTVEM